MAKNAKGIGFFCSGDGAGERDPRTPPWVLVISLALASGASGQTLFDIPIPASPPTIPEILATSSEGGDIQAIFPGAGICDSAPTREISLPADDATHDNTYLEYWWWHGHVDADDGRQLEFTTLFFSKPWAAIQMAQYGITDLTTGAFYQGVEPLILGRPEAIEGGFSLRSDRFTAVGGDGRDELHLDLAGYELVLSLESTKPPVLQWGGDGQTTTYCQRSYYYSRVRMRVAGSLKRAGETVPVTGTANFDRQWGLLAIAPIPNYEYLTFELDDGRDLYVQTARSRENGAEFTFAFGSMSDADGVATPLHREDFTLTPTRYWQRDATCRYPVEWDVEIKGIRLHVRPAVDSTELRTVIAPLSLVLWPEWPALWDGETIVTGDATGRGFLDMGHYCAL